MSDHYTKRYARWCALYFLLYLNRDSDRYLIIFFGIRFVDAVVFGHDCFNILQSIAVIKIRFIGSAIVWIGLVGIGRVNGEYTVFVGVYFQCNLSQKPAAFHTRIQTVVKQISKNDT